MAIKLQINIVVRPENQYQTLVKPKYTYIAGHFEIVQIRKGDK